MKSLFSKILVHDPLLPFSFQDQQTQMLIRNILKGTRSATADPKFNFDSVADFYYQKDQDSWSLSEDCPNWAPPFSSFWAEWRELPEPNERCGAGVMVMDDRSPKFSQEIEKSKKSYYDVEAPDLKDDLDRTKWIICATYWASHKGWPVWTGLIVFVFIDKDGKCLSATVTGPGLDKVNFPHTWQGPTHVLGLGLSFLNCKNIVLVDKEWESAKSNNPKAPKPPTITFKTLSIEPMRKVLRTEGQSETVGIKRALHICRGHFAHYTEERPLFGRLTGDFWIPNHVRGSKERGEVIKDYVVKT